MMLDNPFPVFGYFGAEYFCDRVLETQKMEEALLNGRNVTLIAPRRLGKTGLIHHVIADLEKCGKVKGVYLDIFAVKSLNEFVQVFAQTVFSVLETKLERATKAAGRFLSACRPNISIDSVSGSPTLSFSLDRDNTERTLKDVFDYLATREERIVIAIDEFQQVALFPETGTEALLRSYIQFLPNVRFVFAGSKAHMMSEMFLDASRPFYKSTQNLSLKIIDEETYFYFANSFFKKVGRHLDQAAFDFAYKLVDGITWEVQYVLNRLWSSSASELKVENVRSVINDILTENADEYSTLVANFSINESKVMRTVAKKHRVQSPTGAEFMLETGLSPSSIKLAVDNLCEAQQLYREEDGLLVYDRFFGLWLKRI